MTGGERSSFLRNGRCETKARPVRQGGMAQDQQPRELLRTFYDALNRDDLDAALRLCGEDVEVYQPPDVVASVPAKGHKDVGTYLHGWFESWHAYEPEPE